MPLLVCAVVLTVKASAAPILDIASGRIAGSCDGATCRFLGLPFARPPTGALRWVPPQPALPWHGVRNATKWAPVCPQAKGMIPSADDIIGDEDCLYLNVWTASSSSSSSSSLRPSAVQQPQQLRRCKGRGCAVMVFIHGGAYVTGGAAPPTGAMYDGKTLISRALAGGGDPVVVVTIQYRLGVLGFAGAEELRSRDTSMHSTGNYGIQDQRAALQWVQDNIGAFGGDARNVMIFGESAGGGSVSMHLTMRRSFGLYAKAAIESGAWSYWAAQPMEEAEPKFQDLKSALGCSDAACLMSRNAVELVKAATFDLPVRPRPYGCPYAPTVDGVELQRLPWLLRDAGEVNAGVPVLLGYNKDEGTIGANASRWLRRAAAMTQADFEGHLTGYVGVSNANVSSVVQMYRPNSSAKGADADYTNWYWSGTHFMGDYGFSCPTRRAARALLRAGTPRIFHYYFSNTPLAPPFSFAGIFRNSSVASAVPGTAGASHASELAMVFQSEALDNPQRLRSDAERHLAATISSYWVNFARSSDPNTGAARTNLTVSWRPFLMGEESSLELRLPAFATTQNRLHAQCDLIDSLGVLPLWPDNSTMTQLNNYIYM